MRRLSSTSAPARNLIGCICILLFLPSVALSATAILQWEQSQDPNAIGYRLFCRKQNENYNYLKPIYDGAATRFTIALNDGLTYFFVVRVYNRANLESIDSNEVCYIPVKPVEPGTTAPGTTTPGTTTPGTTAPGTTTPGTT
ncbi:MAG: hypothetical protein ACOZF0_10680, partial [Thermodesulfobacteriota bacterium]